MAGVSNTAKRQALEYEAETTFGEDVTTFATSRIAIIQLVEMSGIRHDKIESMRVTQRLQEGTPHILGVQEGSFRVRMHLAGHGTSTSGSPTVAAHETFLAYAFGTPTSNGTLTATASTTFTGSGTAAAPATTAVNGFVSGGLFRAGAKGDGGGDGQMNCNASHTSSTLNPFFALPALPANLAVLLPCVNFFFPEDPTTAAGPIAVTGLRFRLRTANYGMEFHGCVPTNIEIGGLNTRQTPYIDITFAVSWWRYTATSGISTVATNEFNPAPVAGGSFVINDVGTSTRVTQSIRDFTLTIETGMALLEGPGGVNAYQVIIGARRTESKIRLRWVLDAEAATATPLLDGYFTGTAKKHLMYTLSTTAGSAVGFYFPSLNICGPRPVPIIDGAIARIPIEAEANTGNLTTSDLTLSAMRMGLG